MDDDDTETEAGDLIDIAYTIKACIPYQAPTERYARHKHPLGRSGAPDTSCHRVDHSHCPAGHTEQGGHGSQDCRDDVVHNAVTRIQHLLSQGGRAALDAVVETLKNEAAAQFARLDIDWANFATDGYEQQKLLDVLNPVLRQNNIEIYTLEDVQSLWAGIGRYGRVGAGAVACSVAVEAAMAKLTKGKSLKKNVRKLARHTVDTACGVGAAVPVPDPDDDSSDDSSDSTPDTTPEQTPRKGGTAAARPLPPLTNADLAKANLDRIAGRISRDELEAIKARYRCENLRIQSYCDR